jgi:ABC-type microcin C transport system duplicated ATPase subunit YejF
MMKLQMTGTVVVVGEAGSGKTDVMVCAQRMIFAQSDVSQLRDLYSGKDTERLADAVRKNSNARIFLKPFNPQGEISDE